jgi:DNA-binding MarR family transcriptional regulator
MANSKATDRRKEHAERLAEIFTILQRCFIQNLSKELSRGNVSFPQYFLLGFLSQQSHLTMREVSKKMNHTMAASTGLVDRLERVNLVTRSHDTEDRRRICVRITAKGTALVNQVKSDLVTSLMGLMEHLSSEEIESWVQIYEKIFPLCLQKECGK